MPSPGKTRVLLLAGVGIIGIGTALFFFLQPSDGYLLHKGDLEAAQQHLRLRGERRALKQRLATVQQPVDASERAKHEMRYATLSMRIGMSRFAAVSDADLQHGIKAAKDGRVIEEEAGELSRAIYDGRDDRMDVAEVVAEIEERRSQNGQRRQFLEKALDHSRSVGAWVHAYSLVGGPASATLRAQTLGAGKELCSGERFATQPRAALGTAFLVGPDMVATAAHVLLGEDLTTLRLVFDFAVTKVGENPKTCREIYRISKLHASDTGNGRYDWALVQLKRAVVGGVPLTFAEGSYGLHRHMPIYMWGHSAGTPKKFVEGSVLSNDATTWTIRTKLDAFGGDSGSPVFNQDHQVVGVLFGGSMDWIDSGGCMEAAPAFAHRGGELVTRLELIRPFLDD
jgi:hypothetical protein